jgi:hypothetical protein
LRYLSVWPRNLRAEVRLIRTRRAISHCQVERPAQPNEADVEGRKFLQGSDQIEDPGDRPDVDDMTILASRHVAEHGPHSVQQPFDVNVDGLLPLLHPVFELGSQGG